MSAESKILLTNNFPEFIRVYQASFLVQNFAAEILFPENGSFSLGYKLSVLLPSPVVSNCIDTTFLLSC